MIKRHAEIAGAGFSGLVAATALKQRGWTVRVHEADSKLRAFGAGIYIFENGLRVLRAIGAYEEVIRSVYDGGIMEMRREDKSMIEHRFGPEVGTRMLAMTRQHLYTAILNAARRSGVDEIVTNSEVAEATPEGMLRTKAGREYKADLIIGADGVKSAVRDSLNIPVERVTIRDGVIRLLTTRTEIEAKSDAWNRVIDFWTLSPRPLRILYTPCNENELYLCMMAPSTDQEASSVPVNKNVWSSAFPYLAHIIDRIGNDGRYDVYQTARLASWSVGKVAILGDAAHAMPPTLGQGAGLAMANALGLAVALERASTVEEALKNWEKSERPLTDHTQDYASDIAKARKQGQMFDDLALRAARSVPTGAVP
ncbi:MAG: FAD-dependent oxidoreductase [Xanthobacteraceae bacterium]